MVPLAITAGIAQLQADTAVLQPIADAQRLSVLYVQREAAALVQATDMALAAAVGALDGPDLSGMPQVLVTEFLGLVVSAFDQSALSDCRGFVGRALANLGQVGV